MHCGGTKFTRKSQAISGTVRFVVLSMPARAQPGRSPRVGKGFCPAYDTTRETTPVGAVQPIVLNHETDKPADVHLMIAGRQGTPDAFDPANIAAFDVGSVTQMEAARSPAQ